MTDTETVTVEIADTEVKYDAAECASCGQQYNVEEMTPVLAGEYEDYHRANTFKFNCSPNKLYFCPYCRDEPISLRLEGKQATLALAMLLSIFLGGILAIITFQLPV